MIPLNIVILFNFLFFYIQVEVGAPNGHRSRLRGEGEPHVDGDPGDLIFIFKTERHPQFVRKADDLYTNVTISLQVCFRHRQVFISDFSTHINPYKN